MADTEVSLPVTGADPVADASSVKIYAKSAAGVVRFFARASDGSVYQLTPAVTFPPTALRAANFAVLMEQTNHVDASVGAIVATLPLAASVPGQVAIIKFGTAGVGPCTVTAQGLDDIDGSPTFAMTVSRQSVILVAGSGTAPNSWFLVGTYP